MLSSRHNRGSAFILVVGMMVTLAMVGTVFFMITRADNKESIAATQAAPMRTAAESVILEHSKALGDDLYMGASGPYGAAANFPPPLWPVQYRAYMDYASPDPADTFDRHLASTETAWADGNFVQEGHWPKVTNLGDFPSDAVTDVDPDPLDRLGDADPTNDYFPFVVVGPDGGAGYTQVIDDDGDGTNDAVPLVDADGDGTGDSLLYRTGIFDRNGQEYYAATRLIDLSSFVNVNTAFGLEVPSATIAGIPVTNLELGGLKRVGPLPLPLPLGPDFPIAELHRERCDGTALHGWPEFTGEAAMRPENPDQTNRRYRLYDWSDELACRWRSSTPRMANSRLYRAMESVGGEWVTYSGYLTTGSASRLLPRPTKADAANIATYGADAWKRPDAKVDLNMPLEVAGNPVATKQLREKAFTAYRKAFYHALAYESNDTDRRRTAAQLAVNLIDFRDADDRPTVVSGVDFPGIGLPGAGDAVVGVERQPFISRVWMKVVPQPDDVNGNPVDPLWELAITLYNPYDIPIGLNGWTIEMPAATPVVIPAAPVVEIQPGGRYLIRTSASVVAGGSFDGVIEAKGDSARSPIHILRPGYPLDTSLPSVKDVPVGLVRWSDHERDTSLPSPRAKINPDARQWDPDPSYYLLRRDDNPVLHRVSVAMYTVNEAHGAPTTAVPDHTVTPVPSGPNNVTNGEESSRNSAHMLTDLYPTPVFVRGTNGNWGRMMGVGELGRLLTVGPRAHNRPLDDELVHLVDSPLSSASNWGVGRLDSWGFEDLSDPYPDVPALALAADYFTVDSPQVDDMAAADNDGDGVIISASTPVPASPATDPQWNREAVVHGRINVNTATWRTLWTLPMLAVDPVADPVARMRMAADLLAYRDRLGPITVDVDDKPINNFDFQQQRANVIQNSGYGSSVDVRDQLGFASAGEPAMVMRMRPTTADIMRYRSPATPTAYGYLLGAVGTTGVTDDGYAALIAPCLSKWDLRYAYAGNLLTVNSDTYCAYIWIQLGPGLDPETKRRYIAIIDRSNCVETDDRPMVRAFAEVK